MKGDLDYCTEKCNRYCIARMWFSSNPLSYDECFEYCMEECLS